MEQEEIANMMTAKKKSLKSVIYYADQTDYYKQFPETLQLTLRELSWHLALIQHNKLTRAKKNKPFSN